MNPHRILTIASLLLATSAGSAFAQAAPPAAPTPPPGPPISGLCVFSYDRAVGESAVGRAYMARLQQLGSQVEAELNPERATLQTEAQTLESQRATLAADQFQQRAEALNQRIQAYAAREQLRAEELDQTRNVQLQRIVQQVNPLVMASYTSRNCSVVFDASSLIAINPAMDITDEVVRQLDTQMTTITFDRERLNNGAP